MIQKRIEILKKDSAFVYAILESLEGMTSFSTLGTSQHLCVLELFIAPGFAVEMETVLNGLRKRDIPIRDLPLS